MFGYWLGMNLLWWIFWAAIIVAFFAFLTPVARGRVVRPAEGPLDILDRRYAAGELTTAEYDERRARIAAHGRGAGGVQASSADTMPVTRAGPPPRSEAEGRGELRH